MKRMYGRSGARKMMKGGDLGTQGPPTGRGMPAGKGKDVNVSGPPMNGLSRVRARRRKVRGPGRGAGSIRRPMKGPKIPY